MLNLVSELGFVVGCGGHISHRCEGYTSSLHTGLEIKLIGVSEATAILVVDGDAFAVDVLAFKCHGVKRN